MELLQDRINYLLENHIFCKQTELVKEMKEREMIFLGDFYPLIYFGDSTYFDGLIEWRLISFPLSIIIIELEQKQREREEEYEGRPPSEDEDEDEVEYRRPEIVLQCKYGEWWARVSTDPICEEEIIQEIAKNDKIWQEFQNIEKEVVERYGKTK